MNVVFLGGGSLRLLPLIRGIFSASPDVFRNGTIRLVDREVARAVLRGISEPGSFRAENDEEPAIRS